MNLSSHRFVVASFALVVACAPSTTEDVATSDHSIVGGVETQPGAWPGTVALYVDGEQFCGGALIHPSWVLTAGHCVETGLPNGGIDKVTIGRDRLSTRDGEERVVDRVHRHPGFAPVYHHFEPAPDMNNDLALLHLAVPSTLQTTTLVTSTQRASVADGASVTVVGWGNVSESGREGGTDALRQATVSVIANATCAGYTGYGRLSENMICAGLPSGEHDSCQGDSGGPLFMTLEGKQVQVGIVSWGIGCARPRSPGVYTRVGNYLGWIYETTDGVAGENLPSTGETGRNDSGRSTDGGVH